MIPGESGDPLALSMRAAGPLPCGSSYGMTRGTLSVFRLDSRGLGEGQMGGRYRLPDRPEGQGPSLLTSIKSPLRQTSRFSLFRPHPATSPSCQAVDKWAAVGQGDELLRLLSPCVRKLRCLDVQKFGRLRVRKVGQ